VCAEEPKPGCFTPLHPQLPAVVCPPAKQGVTWEPGWFAELSICLLEEQCGNESVGTGRWVIPGAKVPCMREINVQEARFFLPAPD